MLLLEAYTVVFGIRRRCSKLLAVELFGFAQQRTQSSVTESTLLCSYSRKPTPRVSEAVREAEEELSVVALATFLERYYDALFEGRLQYLG